MASSNGYISRSELMGPEDHESPRNHYNMPQTQEHCSVEVEEVEADSSSISEADPNEYLAEKLRNQNKLMDENVTVCSVQPDGTVFCLWDADWAVEKLKAITKDIAEQFNYSLGREALRVKSWDNIHKGASLLYFKVPDGETYLQPSYVHRVTVLRKLPDEMVKVGGLDAFVTFRVHYTDLYHELDDLTSAGSTLPFLKRYTLHPLQFFSGSEFIPKLLELSSENRPLPIPAVAFVTFNLELLLQMQKVAEAGNSWEPEDLDLDAVASYENEDGSESTTEDGWPWLYATIAKWTTNGFFVLNKYLCGLIPQLVKKFENFDSVVGPSPITIGRNFKDLVFQGRKAYVDLYDETQFWVTDQANDWILVEFKKLFELQLENLDWSEVSRLENRDIAVTTADSKTPVIYVSRKQTNKDTQYSRVVVIQLGRTVENRSIHDEVFVQNIDTGKYETISTRRLLPLSVVNELLCKIPELSFKVPIPKPSVLETLKLKIDAPPPVPEQKTISDSSAFDLQEEGSSSELTVSSSTSS